MTVENHAAESMGTSTAEPPSLRERKRAATHATIERAAIDLSLEHGYDNVTVDMICDASMVSPRTFFNYFGSKEGVVLGAPPRMPTGSEIERFVQDESSDDLRAFVILVIESLVPSDVDRDLYQARRALIQRTPELFAKRMERIRGLEDAYVDIVVARLTTRDDVASRSLLGDEARMIVALGSGVVTYAGARWFSPEFRGSVHELIADTMFLLGRVISAHTQPDIAVNPT